MNTYTAKCDICGTENTVASYGDWACRQCGQGYAYDECHQIRLTDSQWALLRNPPRWIPVEERLPDRNIHVIARCRGGQAMEYLYADGLFFRNGEERRVTHWQYFPETPQDDE